MSVTPTPVLEVRHLAVSFTRRRREAAFRALDDVSLSIKTGRTMGLIGESGSGKSTLANAVLGLAPVEAGSISLLGEDITTSSSSDRRRLAQSMQAVFQDPNSSLDPAWTIERCLAEPMRLQGERDRRKIRHRTLQLLSDIGLDEKAGRRYPAQFSGGQRQRISIARALMTSPRLVICDESVSALDLSVQAQVLNLLSDLQTKHQLSYLFISHNMSVVRHACHDVTVLYRGQVMETGPTPSVTVSPAHPYTQALLLAVPVADPLAQRERARQAEQTARPQQTVLPLATKGCPFFYRCPFAAEICRSERPPLREIGGDRSVACHRFPEWRSEANNPAGTTGSVTPEPEPAPSTHIGAAEGSSTESADKS